MNSTIIKDKHIHGKNLINYARAQKGDKKAIFLSIVDAYDTYRSTLESIQELDTNGVQSFVSALNEYRKIAVPVFDKLSNSGQKALGYTIMEEFFYLLFQKHIELSNIKHDNLFVGKGNSYVSLSFTPSSFENIFSTPNEYIHTKDQDFMLGASIEIQVSAEGNQTATSTVIPVVAIECKTYLERNMLDSCAATASRLKAAMPYCIYFVAAEYMKMSDASPELTDIEEVYILTRKNNAERERRKKAGLPPLDIKYDLVVDLYNRICRHLNAIWWNPEEAVNIGKIINRP